MSAGTYNWLFAIWLVITVLRVLTGGSEVAVIGSFIVAVICGAAADILKAQSSGADKP